MESNHEESQEIREGRKCHDCKKFVEYDGFTYPDPIICLNCGNVLPALTPEPEPA